MATDKAGRWIGLGVGDSDSPMTPRTAPNWNAIQLLTGALARWGGKGFGVQTVSTYDENVARAVEQFCVHSKVNLPVVRDANGLAVANLSMRARLGSYPPPPPPTHALFTVRGTGGVIGQDYTSQVAQASPGHYHEHPIDYPATMGGIPVAVAGTGPSGNECAELARQMLRAAVLGSTVTFAVTGYSLGNKGLVLFLNDLFNPEDELYQHRDRLVCALLIADPWRPYGATFYGAPIPEGEGIGTPSFTMSQAARQALGYRCCWLTNPTDMYANAPLGGTGAILDDVQDIVLNLDMADPMGTMMAAIQELAKIVTQDAGLMQMLGAPADAGPQGGTTVGGLGGLGGLLPGGIGGILGGLGGLGGGLLGGGSLPSMLLGIAAGGPLSPALALAILPLLLGGFQGLLDGITTNGVDLPKGPAADVQAMVLALKFYGSGIAGHLHYHDTPWSSHGPQTYLQLGIQHVNDWGARVPVQA